MTACGVSADTEGHDRLSRQASAAICRLEHIAVRTSSARRRPAPRAIRWLCLPRRKPTR
jgi:hypothetical protein